MSRQRKENRPPARKLIFFFILCGIALGAVAVVALWARRNETRTVGPPPQASPIAPVNEAALFASYGKSPSCKSCHEETYRLWQNSHHALAERPLNPALDTTAFEPS